jgi:tRNA (guanine37-N1)-methyltransferase
LIFIERWVFSLDFFGYSRFKLGGMTENISFPVCVVTVAANWFPGPLAHGVTGRALQAGRWRFDVENIRDYALDAYGSVDDTPYGGGAGMVLKADVVGPAVLAAKKAAQPGAKVVLLAPHGVPFTQAKAQEWAQAPEGLILLCGHYEGIDARVEAALVDEVVSLGNFVLSGGELAAMVVVDAVVRLLPGVLGAAASLHEESFTLSDPVTGKKLIEYPHFTRPPVWEGQAVPDVLLSGNHAAITTWRLAQARARTAAMADEAAPTAIPEKAD